MKLDHVRHAMSLLQTRDRMIDKQNHHKAITGADLYFNGFPSERLPKALIEPIAKLLIDHDQAEIDRIDQQLKDLGVE